MYVFCTEDRTMKNILLKKVVLLMCSKSIFILGYGKHMLTRLHKS